MESLGFTTLIWLAVAIRISQRLLYGARGPEPGDPLYGGMTFVVRSLALIGVGAAAISGAAAIFLSTLMLPLILLGCVETLSVTRTTQRRNNAAVLGVAAQRKLPIDPALGTPRKHRPARTAIGRLFGRFTVTRPTASLAEDIRDGVPIATAVERHPRALPTETAAVVAVGQAIGNLPAAMQEMADESDGGAGRLMELLERSLYTFYVILVAIFVCTFMMIKIVPEFEKMFTEFGMELPMLTIALIRASSAAVQAWPLIAPPVLLVVMFVGAAVVLEALDIQILTPLYDRLIGFRHRRRVLNLIALAMEQRQPLGPVVDALARRYPATAIARRLRATQTALEQGMPWTDALVVAKLIRGRERALVRSAAEAGNGAWALRQLGRRGETRGLARLNYVADIVHPLLVCVVGLAVAFFVIGLFLPLVDLIQALTF